MSEPQPTGMLDRDSLPDTVQHLTMEDFAWDAPIPRGRPAEGQLHLPRARALHVRQIGEFQVLGICHNTSDTDMQAVFTLSQLAARRALLVPEVAPESVTFVEVGTWCGEGAVAIAAGFLDVYRQYCQGIHVEFYLVLVDTFEGTQSDPNMDAMQGYNGSILEMCRDNIEQLKYIPRSMPGCESLELHVNILQERSTAVAESLEEHDTLDFVYLDADHSWEGLTADFRAWWPLLRPGSWLGGHDYNPRLFPNLIIGVDQLCQELGKCSALGFPNTSVWAVRKPPLVWSKGDLEQLL